MKQLRLRLGLQSGGAIANQPPTDIAWAGSHTVAEDAALGTQIGGALTATDPELGVLTFSLVNDANGLFGIGPDGESIIVTGVLDFETAASHNITIRVSDGELTYDEIFPVTVTDVSETAPDDPLPDGDVVTDDTFTNPPVATTVDGSVKLHGKKAAGVLGKFLYDLGAPAASTIYTAKYDPDFSLLTNTGKNALVGFALKSGNSFLIVGLRGDGTTGLDVYTVSGETPNGWAQGTGLTESDEGAPTNGTQAGPNWIQLEFNSAGTEATFRTSADGVTWADDLVITDLSPFTDVGDATQFGPGAMFWPTDTGSFSIAFEAWITETLTPGQWSSTYKASGITLSNNDRTATTSAVVTRNLLGNAPITRKTYWEVEVVSHSSGNIILGLAVQGHKTNVAAPSVTNMGHGYNSNGSAASPLNVTYTAGDRIGFAYDPAVGGLWISKNGVWLGNDTSGAPVLSVTDVNKVFVTFGGYTGVSSFTLMTDPATFETAAPSGYFPLYVADYPAYRWSTFSKGANITLSENDTKATKASTGHHNVKLGTEPCKGKQVFAIELTADGAGSTAKCVGLLDWDDSVTALMGANGFGIGYRSGGTVVRNGSTLQTYTAWGSVGDILMIATDADTNELWFGLNGSWNGDPAAGTGEVGQWINDGSQQYGLVACGATDAGDAFKLIDWPYAIPSGFTAPPMT